MRDWICGRCYTGLTGDTATTCPSCGGTDIVPRASPRGQQLAAQVAPTGPPPVIETKPGDAVCPSCLAFGRPTKTGPSGFAQLVLVAITLVAFLFVWPVGLLMLLILIIYSAQPAKKICGKCGGAVIPADSARGQELVRDLLKR